VAIGSLCPLVRELLIGCGGKASCPAGRQVAVVLQGLHTVLGGSWEHREGLCLGWSQSRG